MSINRLGIILRKEPPPATVGEVGLIASCFHATASEIILAAENAVPLAPVTQLRANVVTPVDTIDHVDAPDLTLPHAAKRGRRKADQAPHAD